MKAIFFKKTYYRATNRATSPNYYSRKNEINADKWSIETTGLVVELSEALKRLARNNLVNLSPHPLYAFLNYTHPPLIRRLEIIKKNR